MNRGINGTDSVGVFENRRGDVLICRPRGGSSSAAAWCFPSTEIRDSETPEGAIRRAARELGLTIRVHTAQPPVARDTVRGRRVYRYHFCQVVGPDALADLAADAAYEELRWISKAHLREYEFAGQDADVVAWMLADGPS